MIAIPFDSAIKLYRADIDELAQVRADNLGNGRVNLDKPHLHYERIGMAGELGFSYLTGLPISVYEKNRGRDMGDFRFDRYNIDVKTSAVGGDLLVKHKEIRKPIDIYVLAYYYDDVNPTVCFVGWQFRAIVKKCKLKTTRLGECFAVPINRLRGMSSLFNKIREFEESL